MKAEDLTKNEIQIINVINSYYSTINKEELQTLVSQLMNEEETETALNSLQEKNIVEINANYIVSVNSETINDEKMQEAMSS